MSPQELSRQRHALNYISAAEDATAPPIFHRESKQSLAERKKQLDDGTIFSRKIDAPPKTIRIKGCTDDRHVSISDKL